MDGVRLWMAAIGPVVTAGGFFWAVWVFRAGRKDQALRDASGLHAEMYEQAQELPESMPLPKEPGEWTEGEMIVRLKSSAPHAFYSVMVSVWMPAQKVRLCGYADVIGPGQTLYARMGLSVDPGGDGAERADEDSSGVRVTFRDGLGRAWLREPDGTLTPAAKRAIKASRHSRLWGRSCPAVGLHGLRDDGGLDWDDYRAKITLFSQNAEVVKADHQAVPPQVWSSEEILESHSRQGKES